MRSCVPVRIALARRRPADQCQIVFFIQVVGETLTEITWRAVLTTRACVALGTILTHFDAKGDIR